MKSLNVKCSRPYDVFIGKNLIDSIGDVVSENRRKCRALVLTDETVRDLYYARALRSLKSCGVEAVPCVLLPGEASKSFESYNKVIGVLTEQEFSRQDVVVSLGGGVVGDVAGFAASTYMRGIGLFQVPTTLLAMVDASVGGKNGINSEKGKNLIGTIYQPESVLCDTELLKTLPDEIFRDGLAEVIKCGVIRDARLFAALENEDPRLRNEDVIYRCVEIKRNIVQEDETDKNIRHLLNFGHTYGHAVEKLSGYTIRHGHAVMIGMILMARAARNMKLCREDCVPRLKNIARKYGLPVSTSFRADELTAAVMADKKRGTELLELVMPLTIGYAEIVPIRLDRLDMLTAAALNEQSDETQD
ncbi:MAG: 3-dehydroquinate synthase [Eubacteriales bacterium]|nr:3-dehydroquinate synthase [Eubacteriales bacterium]